MVKLNLLPCEPPFWATNGHAQTLWGHLLPSRKLPRGGTRREIKLPDGDRLLAHYFPGNSDIVLYLFHGLAGDISSDYMERTANIGFRYRHSVYLVNHRGCGAGQALARGAYHSGRGDDISEVIAFGRAHHPGKRHLAIGFSLSGNALLCLLTGLRGTVQPDLAISVNAPIDLERASHLLERGLNRLYDARFVRSLSQHIRSRQALGLVARSYSIPRFCTLRDFDSLFTAPEGGFENREDYYQTCSTHLHLHKISVPTILLTAQDDPFVSFQSYSEAKLSPDTALHIERTGGHMGYLSRRRTPIGTYRWLDYALDEGIRALVDANRVA